MLRRLLGSTSLVLLTLCSAPVTAQEPAWVQKSPADSPTGRMLSGMAYDTARGEVVLFGGFDGTNHNDTWVWDGSNWTQQSPANSPTPRQVLAMTTRHARKWSCSEATRKAPIYLPTRGCGTEQTGRKSTP